MHDAGYRASEGLEPLQPSSVDEKLVVPSLSSALSHWLEPSDTMEEGIGRQRCETVVKLELHMR